MHERAALHEENCYTIFFFLIKKCRDKMDH